MSRAVYVVTIALLLWSCSSQTIISGNSTQSFGSSVLQAASCLNIMAVTRTSASDTGYVASVGNKGCFTLQADARLTTQPIARQIGGYSAADPTVVQCAAYCELQVAQGLLNVSQFAVTNRSCYCLSTTDLSRVGTPNPTASCCDANSTCPGINLIVWQLELVCSLSPSLCGDGCNNVEGCCLPGKPPAADLSDTLLLLQTIVGVLMVASGLYFAYKIVFRRRRQHPDDDDAQRDLHERRFVLPGGDLDEAIVMIGVSSLPIVAECCVDLFPDAQGLAEDATCCVCLESLTGVDVEAIETPCKHSFHRDCMTDFIAHKLRTSLEDLACPMCRSVIICQLLDEDSELGRLRRSLFEMRNGRRRPVTTPPVAVASTSPPRRRAPAMEEAQALLEMTPQRERVRERSASLDGGTSPADPVLEAALGPAEPLLDLGPHHAAIAVDRRSDVTTSTRHSTPQPNVEEARADPVWAAL